MVEFDGRLGFVVKTPFIPHRQAFREQPAIGIFAVLDVVSDNVRKKRDDVMRTIWQNAINIASF